MNNRFTLPVAVAVAVHATLLFGFKHTPFTPPGKPAIKKDGPPRIPLPPEEIELVDSRQSVPKGSPDAPRPEPEIVVPSLTPPLFPMAQNPPGIVRLDPLGPPSSEPPGVPGGTFEDVPFINITGLDNPPTARVRIPPDYPFSAKQAGLQGDVMVEFSVDETGRVYDPRVLKSSDRMFEESTLRAVQKWRFEPGKRNGRAVRFRMAIPVVFRLDNN